VLTNDTALAAFTHAVFGALVVGGMFLLGIAWYHLWRRRRDRIDDVDEHGRVIVGEAPDTPGRDRTDHGVWIWSLRFGAIVATLVPGDVRGQAMYGHQPV